MFQLWFEMCNKTTNKKNSEDNFNVHLDNVVYKDLQGRESKLKAVFIRGSKIKMIILPYVLSNTLATQRLYASN